MCSSNNGVQVYRIYRDNGLIRGELSRAREKKEDAKMLGREGGASVYL